MTDLDRFNSKWTPVTEMGCWLWTDSVDEEGYGLFHLHGKTEKAHRAAFSLFVGAIGEGMYVRHRCDVRTCVNPAHLFQQTPEDAFAQQGWRHSGGNRNRVGAANSYSKLTDEDVRNILKSPLPQNRIAEIYGVTPMQISRIKRRKAWKHIQLE